jgi:hypothetical protein
LRELGSLIWLLLLTGLLLLMQRSLHREIQAVFLLITRNAGISQALFSLLFFPGIVLHEASHYGMALILRVRTGHFSVIPRQIDGKRLQLGYIETERTDVVRDALIGAAPLLTGGLVVAYIGLVHFGLTGLGLSAEGGNVTVRISSISDIFSHPDFWLWLYLAFVVSSTMMPSKADRRAWLPFALIILLIAIISVLGGAGPWLEQTLAPALYSILRSIAVVFGISDAIHLALWPPFFITRHLLEHFIGIKVT